MSTDREADVLIIGAGIAGTSLAWHLAEHRGVHVIEQAPHHCAEASAQNAGMIRRLVDDRDERDLVCRSHELLRSLPSDDWADDPPFRRTGAMIAVASTTSAEARALEHGAIALRAAGVAVESVAGSDLEALAPPLAGSPVERGYWVPDDGVCDPRALGNGFVRGARRRGARFSFDTRVHRLLRDGDRILGVATDRGQFHARVVVLASAAWTSRLAAPLGLGRPTRALARHLLLSKPHPLATPEQPYCWIDDAGIYARSDGERFACSPCDEIEVPAPHGPGSMLAMREAARATTIERIHRFLPALADVDLSQGWAGLRTFTADRRQLVGPDPCLGGLYWLTALGGAGVGCAFALGERVATALRGAQPHEHATTV